MGKRQVVIVPPDPTWPQRFEEEAAALRAVFGPSCTRIHHVGSTAVPGLAAKPIIDILIEVEDITAVDGFDGALEMLGYRPRGENGVPGRRYFHKGGNQRTHHVHVFQVGAAQVAHHLAFRDSLRSNPALLREYAELKRRLAQRHAESPADYQSGKSGFIEEHQARALQSSSGGDAKHENAEPS